MGYRFGQTDEDGDDGSMINEGPSKYTLREAKVVKIADTVELTADFIRETDKAILVSDGDQEVWLPKSQIDYGINEFTKTIAIELPEWLATAKGLV